MQHLLFCVKEQLKGKPWVFRFGAFSDAVSKMNKANDVISWKMSENIFKSEEAELEAGLGH